MVAELPFLFCARPPAGRIGSALGDRFRYFRGLSGRRYLFTLIDREDIADFRSAVVMLARREVHGGINPVSVTAVDDEGSPAGARRWPPAVPQGCLVLVHLLAKHAQDRDTVAADLASARFAPG